MKMKLITFVLGITLLSTLTSFSCQKDNFNLPKSDDSLALVQGLNIYAMQTNEVQNIGGLLYFESQDVVDNVLISLESLEKNTEYVNTYLTILGFGVQADVDSIPFKPIVKKFNQRFNFESLQAHWEVLEREHFHNGGEVETKPKNFLADLDFAGLLNKWGEIKIGNLIYKYIDEHHIFVVLDGDFNTMQFYRNNNPLTMDILPRNTILLNTIFEEDNEFLKNLMLPECGYKVDIIQMPGDPKQLLIYPILIKKPGVAYPGVAPTITIQTIVTDADGNIIGDQTETSNLGSITPSPIKFVLPNGNYNYPLSVRTIVQGTSFCDSVVGGDVTVKVDKENCVVPNFEITETPVHKYNVKILNPKVGVNYKWIINVAGIIRKFDGGDQTIDLSSLLSTPFSGRISVALAQEGNGCIKEKTLNAGCGASKDGIRFRTISHSSITKSEVEAWIGSSNSAGARFSHYKKVWWGWKKATASKASVNWVSTGFNVNNPPSFMIDCTDIGSLPEHDDSNISTFTVKASVKKGKKITFRSVRADFFIQLTSSSSVEGPFSLDF